VYLVFTAHYPHVNGETTTSSLSCLFRAIFLDQSTYGDIVVLLSSSIYSKHLRGIRRRAMLFREGVWQESCVRDLSGLSGCREIKSCFVNNTIHGL
jgi:hypothetical protein